MHVLDFQNLSFDGISWLFFPKIVWIFPPILWSPWNVFKGPKTKQSLLVEETLPH